MQHKKSFLFFLLIATCFCFILAAKPHYTCQTNEWLAPKSADLVKNPLISDLSATAEGKKIFKQMCAICHGNTGKGDGIAGISLNPRPTNLSLAKIQSQSDGALFWKMTEGRAPMASYKEALSEQQRWKLVNYIRTLKK